MLRNDLVGTWQLLSFEVEDSPGSPRPWGTNIQGTMIYTKDGYVTVCINKEIHTTEPSAQEILDSSLCYAGTFYIEGRNRVVHVVTMATDPLRRGKEMMREAHLSDDSLTLTGNNEHGAFELTWERISRN